MRGQGHRIFVDELERFAADVTDRRVGEFLLRRDTVIARMAGAVDVVEAAGMAADRCDAEERRS
jgi:hypothetical protein